MKKRIISILLCALLVIGVMPITAFASNDVAYLDGRTLVITENGFTSAISGFAKSDYDKVVFKEGVTNIVETAFRANTTITSFVFEGDVTLSQSIFAGSAALTEIIFKGEATIGKNCFKDATMLRRLIFNAPVTVDENAFENCGTSYGVEMLPLYIPGNSTFELNSMRESGFTELHIMGGNVTFDNFAFYDNEKLTSITAYGDGHKLGTYSFNECSALEKVDFDGSVELNLFTFLDDTHLKDASFGKGTQFCSCAFYGTAIEELNIPYNSVIKSGANDNEGEGAFAGMEHLKEIIFNDSMPMVFFENTFYIAPNTLKIIVPKGSKDLYKGEIAKYSSNNMYVNCVVESDDTSYILVAANNPDAGTVTTNLGECYPSAFESIGIDDVGAVLTCGYMENGKNFQIHVEPNPGYVAYARWIDDDYAFNLSDNNSIMKIYRDTMIEIIFERHSDEDHDWWWEYNTDAHWKYCDYCEFAINVGEHEYGPDGTCMTCGYTIAEKNTYMASLADNEVDPSEYDEIMLWVGSHNVTRNNCNDILGDGKVSYDFDTSTLTLDNADIDEVCSIEDGTGIMPILAGIDNLTINIKGECVISAENYNCMSAYGIINEGNLTINGLTDDASLTIRTANGLQNSNGIAGYEVTINEVEINCEIPGSLQGGTAVKSASWINILSSKLNLTCNNIFMNHVLENNMETSDFNGMKACDGNITITGSTVSISGFYYGISCPGKNIILPGSDVSITADTIGIVANMLMLDNMESLCIFAKNNFNDDIVFDVESDADYVFMVSKHEDSRSWSFLNADSDITALYTDNLMIYKVEDVIPQDGYSPVLGNTSFSFDKNVAEVDCCERLCLTATFDTENYGEVDGLTYGWCEIINGEQGDIVSSNINCVDAPIVLSEGFSENPDLKLGCYLIYGGTTIDSDVCSIVFAHNRDYKYGEFESCDNVYHGYLCGCDEGYFFEEEHSYDKNGICTVCGYKRVELSSNQYPIDNVCQYIIVDDADSASFDEDDFTLSDETCFIEVYDENVVLVYRCGTVLAEYVTLTEDDFNYGDVNGDGWVDGQDAILALCIQAGLLSQNDVGYVAYKSADFNKNGEVDDSDIEVMMQAGLLLMSVDRSQSEEILLETNEAYREYLSLIGQDSSTENQSTEEPVNEKADIVDIIINLIKWIFETFFNYFKSFLTIVK